MRNMKAAMQNTLWSKIKRRVYPNHAKKSLRIILLWDFRNCILWYYTFEMCPKKVDWNVKPFFATGLAETQVGHAIANIGSLVGGLLSPHHERKNKDKRRGKFGSDDATYDDNIISLTVSTVSPLFSLCCLFIVSKVYYKCVNLILLLLRSWSYYRYT